MRYSILAFFISLFINASFATPRLMNDLPSINKSLSAHGMTTQSNTIDSDLIEVMQIKAEQGDATAQFDLGYLAYKDENYAQAKSWWLKAAKQNNRDAQHGLGELYFWGSGVEQNYPKAEQWYLKAGYQGSAYSQYKLGVLAFTAKDYVKANAWFLKAAKQGHALAQYALGEAYRSGLGVKQDYPQAEQWYQKAAAQGNEKAKDALAHLQKLQHESENQSDAEGQE